eukprot:TRINITY_DN584_c0_g1_i3.p1 TRINITY_DN584_c0_g1~~TRINITY_DN584_c0_g1_i3.p1  ORF type:complete len:136 (+),score=43.35 TRINITY_DN584_c0_g1_i3:85-492(+)
MCIRDSSMPIATTTTTHKLEALLTKTDEKVTEEAKRPAILKQNIYPKVSGFYEKMQKDEEPRSVVPQRSGREASNLTAALKILNINVPTNRRESVSPQPRLEFAANNDKGETRSRGFQSPQYIDSYMTVRQTKAL